MSPRSLAARIALAAPVAGLALFLTGAELIGLLAPALAAATDALSPLAVPRVVVSGALPDARIEAIGFTTAPVAIGTDAHLPPATRLGPVSISLVHGLVPPALLLAALAAWPCASRREAPRRLLLALPALLLVVLATVPPHLAGLFAAYVDAYRSAAGGSAAGAARAALPAVEAMLFLEAGGRWLVPIVAAAACVALARRPGRAPRADRRTTPLDPALVAEARAARQQRAA